jgi:hypothetical protein
MLSTKHEVFVGEYSFGFYSGPFTVLSIIVQHLVSEVATIHPTVHIAVTDKIPETDTIKQTNFSEHERCVATIKYDYLVSFPGVQASQPYMPFTRHEEEKFLEGQPDVRSMRVV